jgi:alginate O-acetyltransferase complex protein AlgJ
VEVLDLRPALMELKKEHLCYQPQESHWNGVGAFAAYQQIAQRLRTWYPDLRVMEMSDCEIYQQRNAETDLLRLQGKENLTTVMDCVRPVNGFTANLKLDPDHRDEKTHQLTRSRRTEATIGKLLMTHDSFANLMLPFLAEHFRDAVYFWTDDDGSLPQRVLACRPDVVIEEIVERQLCGREPDLLKPPASLPNNVE